MYFEPEMEVINLKLQGMLCGSIKEDGESKKDDEEGGDSDFD